MTGITGWFNDARATLTKFATLPTTLPSAEEAAKKSEQARNASAQKAQELQEMIDSYVACVEKINQSISAGADDTFCKTMPERDLKKLASAGYYVQPTHNSVIVAWGKSAKDKEATDRANAIM